MLQVPVAVQLLQSLLSITPM